MNTKDIVLGPAERLLNIASSLIDLGSALDVIAGWVRNAGREAKDIVGAMWFDRAEARA